MNKIDLFEKIKSEIGSKLNFLEDKPEETLDSTLKALWLKASGISRSSEEALKSDLPDITEQQRTLLYQLIEQRINLIPLAHITGRQSFMGIELITDKRALIPRKETEILGRRALEISKEISQHKKKVTVIDVCCGAGNLGLAIALLNPNTIVYSADLSSDAVELAQENISFLNLNNRVQVYQGDLLSAFETDKYYNKINLIVCNPPYISSTKATKMNSEISSNEPILAFDGGMLGTKIIQKLIQEAPKFLAKNGWVIFEVGVGQGEFIMQLCKKSNRFNQIDSGSDDLGNIRVVLAQNREVS